MRLLVEYDVAAAIHDAHAARFVDAFLQNLAGLVFAVVAHLIFIDRLVQLAFTG